MFSVFGKHLESVGDSHLAYGMALMFYPEAGRGRVGIRCLLSMDNAPTNLSIFGMDTVR